MKPVPIAILLSLTLTPAWAFEPPKEETKQKSAIPSDLKRVDTNTEIGELVLVDGSAHPELIPEYLAWQSVLFDIALAKQKNPAWWRHMQDLLGLSARDEGLVLAAAAKEFERHNRDAERIEKVANEQRARGEVVKTFDLMLEGRRTSLGLVDELMSKLSPEGQASLVSFKAYTVERLSVSVPAGAWDTFKLPR